MRVAKIALGVTVALFLAGTARAANTILGSAHDFSTQTSWNPGGQICQPCHTPHHANLEAGLALWNRTTNATTYTRETVGVTSFLSAGGSKACLGCHDGSTALGSGGVTMATAPARTNPANGATYRPVIGAAGNLDADHPIGVKYPYTSGSTRWKDPATTMMGSRTLQQVLALDPSGVSTTDYYVQCTTCHSAHSGYDGYLLRVANAASTLCLSCHIK